MQQESGFGRFVAGKRSKWITLAVWIIVVGVLSALWPMVNKEVQNNAADLNEDTPSVQAEQVAAEQFSGGSSIPALLVWHRDGGMKDEDVQHVQKLFGDWGSSPLPYQDSVPPFDKMPAQALKAQLSKDQSTLVTPVLFKNDADSDQLKEGVEKLKEQAAKEFGADPFAVKQNAAGEISARVTGPVGISIDAVGLFKNADFKLLMATVVLVLVILLLIYRSPILALIPLVAVGFAYGAISPLLGLMASKGWITVDSQAVSIMTVLLFGAGTDYCLFLVSHFRHLLQAEESKGKALLRAITETSGAIAMSGFTVVLSLLALLLAKYGAYHRFAIPFSVSILVMVIASLTLVPALLAIFGRISFFPFIPRTPEMEEERARRKGKKAHTHRRKKESFVGKWVVTKPWLIVIVTLVVLGGLASFSSQVKFTYDIMSSFPKDMASREGYDTIGKQFSPGELAPVKLMVDTGGQDVLGAKLAELPSVNEVSKPQAGEKNANILAYDIELKMNPYSSEAIDLIPQLRATAEQSLKEAGIASPAEKVWISGQTATQYDTRETGDRDTMVIIPVVIGMITLLLLLYLRSITATVYLVLTVILSYFSALGLGWIIIHYGLGADAIQGAIPLYSFVFLVALGEDYNIFMISSIWKKRKEMPLKQAIKEGVGETSSVITSAGLILAGTFAVLASLPIQVLVQFGIITAVGVLLDTFIVRPFLVPAITTLLGRFAFWPSKHAEVKEGAVRREA
ncbi:MMPL family transporter [Paenibacillus chibensis]|uniref:MMPL family transporter n=1 Tax=Paenibacillus chibensis TaxID=59846 RepID=UPI000FD95AE7|nr:MMPL family transporter [Paenibacillus chibensis]MEC0369553.1 MMPL family transporter [Paenibacillus chibensis]